MSTTPSSHARPLATRGALAGRAGQLASSLPSRSWPCIAAVLLLFSLPLSGVAAQTIHAAAIASASQRFGIPEAWIRAVMRAESAGDRHAVSHRGAMGLMQVMPATWAGLRAQHGLGADPFAPQDNILAGTAYLREMLERFGSVSLMLAAYNAGPRRVEAHLATGSRCRRRRGSTSQPSRRCSSVTAALSRLASLRWVLSVALRQSSCSVAVTIWHRRGRSSCRLAVRRSQPLHHLRSRSLAEIERPAHTMATVLPAIAVPSSPFVARPAVHHERWRWDAGHRATLQSLRCRTSAYLRVLLSCCRLLPCRPRTQWRGRSQEPRPQIAR